MDKLLFAQACENVINRERQQEGIGTLGEKTLHAVLKEYYEPYAENHEVKVGSFVADIVGENGIIEIQTANFGKLIKKLDVFLEYCDVTVVHPIAARKHLIWLDGKTGELVDKRKSPKHLTIYDAADELYVIRYALDNPRFHLRLCLLEVEETRFVGKNKKNRREGSLRVDRVPIALLDEVEFDCPDDYKKFIPAGLPEEFTCKDFAKLAKTHTGNARRIINILIYLEKVCFVRKGKNREYIYRIKE
ncbi:MAG: hypothetical protein IJC65_03935 [Oscillospiraceae bacterium]|nr:hypothetical protein [Oscillospiraceae bacterium]